MILKNLVDEIISLVVEKCLETPNPIAGDESCRDTWLVPRPSTLDWNQGTSLKLGELAALLK